MGKNRLYLRRSFYERIDLLSDEEFKVLADTQFGGYDPDVPAILTEEVNGHEEAKLIGGVR